ncbi:hypothetical protein ACFL20_07975 [Spirochaetota bacterium]
MTNYKDLMTSLNGLRGEILLAIRGMMTEITGGDVNTPVNLEGVSLFYSFGHRDSFRDNLRLCNIFYDDDGKLCGDFIDKNNATGNDFLFGKCVEDLNIEDLMNILKSLDGKDNNKCETGIYENMGFSGKVHSFMSSMDSYFKKHGNV